MSRFCPTAEDECTYVAVCIPNEKKGLRCQIFVEFFPAEAHEQRCETESVDTAMPEEIRHKNTKRYIGVC